MNIKASLMKNEIHTIAGYRALKISKYSITLLLGITTLYLGFLRYPASPFYILLILNILPPISNHAFKEYATKYSANKLLHGIVDDIPFQLNNLLQHGNANMYC